MPKVLIKSVPAPTSGECPNCVVTLQSCFRYPDPKNGDIVTTALLQDYVQLIAIRVCTLVQNISTQGSGLVNLNNRVTTLEKTPAPTFTLPSLFPICVSNPNESLPLDVFAQKTETLLCQLMDAAGTPSALFGAIVTPSIDGLNTQNALGTSGGKMSALSNWVSDPKNVADTIQNMWASIMDLRSGLANVKLNCCNTTCDDVEVVLQATLTAPVTVKLFFTGAIPGDFQNCVPGGTLFKIADQSGHYINATVDVKSSLNDPTGYSVDISGSPLNVSDDFNITATLCFFDQNTGSQCQSTLSFYLANTLDCPAVTWTPSQTSVAYSFNHTGGALTYTVQLLNSGNVPVDVQSFVVTGPIAINGTFSGLTANTLYKGRVQMTTSTTSKICPSANVTTGVDTCPAIQSLTSTLSIP